MGHNLSQEGLESVVGFYDSKSKKEIQDTSKVNDDWKRLANFMSGYK